MFLAATALRQFWATSSPCFYLGSWCIEDPDSQRVQMLPSPWNDRSKVARAYQYLGETYEHNLALLAGFLNAVHQKNENVRYWRILIGPWLNYFLHVAYDRYIHLQAAFQMDPKLETIVLNPRSYKTPFDTLDFINRLLGDFYNLQLFSQILAAMGCAFPSKSYSEPLKKHFVPIGVIKYREAEESNLSHVPQVGFCEMDFSKEDIRAILAESAMEIPADLIKVEEKEDKNLRAAIKTIFRGDEFSSIFGELVSLNFPILYLEGYSHALKILKETIRKYPEVLISSTGWRFHEPMKFLAGEIQKGGGELFTVQHGGGYGMYRFHSLEHHESLIGDHFFVWGWAKPNTNLHNLPSPRLSMQMDSHSKKWLPTELKILYVPAGQPCYPVGFHSSPLGSQWEDYFEFQKSFFTRLPEYLRKRIEYRLTPFEYGQYQHKRLQKYFPDLLVDSSRPIYEAYHSADLVVIDYFGATAFLEAMTMNIPVIQFYDSRLWEAKLELESDLVMLRKAGILYHSPEDAARKTVEVIQNPKEWWGRQEVQKVRRDFIQQHALVSHDWAAQWRNACLDNTKTHC